MPPTSNAPPGTLIADRYRVECALGRGGMAVVYRVHDLREHCALALKHLRGADRHVEKLTPLFQREYQTLVQLAHPRIVRAHEYGIAEGVPYYTMELLDGDDASSGAPYGWRKACAILRDVASALAVVHSRRLVHRDVKAANVRLTEDGRAKLIDFGALLPMGVTSSAIGTLPFMSPEAFHKQPLDGRADLYSLGALAYWMLTGRHAYPARELAQLRDLWRTRPRSPEQLVADVPPELGALVMSLLSLDVLARPTNASELMDRLAALADLPPDEELGSARAYLVMPSLTGREAELGELRVKLTQGMHGRGSAVCIEGGAGVGRSRLLASFALEARTLGMTVISTDAADAAEDLGTMRALIARLLEAVPASASSLPTELAELAPSPGDEEPAQLTPQALQRLRADGRGALVRFILQMAQNRPLFIAVDDVQFCDGASCAVLAELSRAASSYRLVVAMTAREADPDQEEAMRVLRRAVPSMPLSPLGVELTETLLRSVFGQAANLRQLANWIHGCAQGYPGAIMTLAQHLFDHGHARYQAGRWVLPSDPHALGLADALREALRERALALSEPALVLAQALALSGDRGSIDADDFALLLDAGDGSVGFGAIAELVAADVLRPHGRAYVFSHPAFGATVRERLDAARERTLHIRLAAVYERPNHADTFMAAYHLQCAGELDRANVLLVARANQLTTLTRDPGGGPVRVRYRLAGQTYLRALEQSERSGGSLSERLALCRGLLFVSGQYDPSLAYHGGPMFEQLCRDTGLVHWNELSELEPQARLTRCFALAQQHYDALPEPQRGLPPADAVRVLAFFTVNLSGAFGRLLDVEGLRLITAAMDPLRVLASTLELIAEILTVSSGACMGLEVNDRCAALLERHESDPEHESNLTVQRLLSTMRYYLGGWEARRGGQRALAQAQVIVAQRRKLEDRYPNDVGLSRYHSWHVRLLTHLYNGDVTRAQLCREQIDLLQLDGLDPVIGPAVQAGIFMEARAYAICDSVLDLKGAIEVMTELAQRMPNWRPVLHWARGHYHRQLGDFEGARVELEQAMAASLPGRHFTWSWAAPALVEVLLGVRQYDEALALAQRAALEFDALPLAIVTKRDMQRVLALARAHTGDVQGAAALLDVVLPLAATELGGVPLGQLYEARAQIAVLAHDPAGFDDYAQRALDLYRPGRHPGLLARHERLLELGRRSLPGARAAPAEDREPNPALQLVSSTLQSCSDSSERANAALALLVEHSGASGGYLFAVRHTDVQLAASSDGTQPPIELVRRLQALVEREMEEVTAVLHDGAADSSGARGFAVKSGAIYHPVQLHGGGNGLSLTAIAALTADGAEVPRVSPHLLRAISDYLRDAGDVLPVLVTA